MRVEAFLDTVTRLDWVPPSQESLLVLAQSTSQQTWQQIRTDPGLICLFVHVHRNDLHSPDRLHIPKQIRSAELLSFAIQQLSQNRGTFPCWDESPFREVRQACLRYAQAAELIAEKLETVNPELAWITAMLAPLGWLAVVSVDADRAAECLTVPNQNSACFEAQQQTWGLDACEIARRLTRRWRWPEWLSANVAQLGLPLDLALPFGADRELFLTTQLAVTWVQQREPALGLPVGSTLTELLKQMELPLDWPQRNVSQLDHKQISETGDAPQLDLINYLSVVAENRRQQQDQGLETLERELDALHGALREQSRRESHRLRELNLASLAELAAGAGHEINNPLAVISGQAQRLLGKLKDESAQKSLQTIIGQTRRIHGILRELMQFARPPAPHKEQVDVLRVVDEVIHELAEQASRRHVRIESYPSSRSGKAFAPIHVNVDPKHLRTACTCLILNAIEAAGSEGLVQVNVTTQEDHVAVRVKNTGAPMDLIQREHSFDPFYSGRPAGRGLGLGLPTAWALARQQGGEVLLVSPPGEPTCFVLKLPPWQAEEESWKQAG